MDAKARLAVLREVRRRMDSGESASHACFAAGVTPRWFAKWSARLAEGGADALADAPRSGRPRSVEVSPEDALKLKKTYLRSNRGRNCGSMTMAARWLAMRGELAPELCEAILKPRASKHLLPAAVREALREVPRAAFARYRDPGSGKSDGIYMPGWLRMAQDGSRRLLPGERQVWDDASVNVCVCVPWPQGGDKCSDRFGVRVARYQLLFGIDCATDHAMGYSYVCRASDAYRQNDVVRALFGVWGRNGWAPREVVLEGGSWSANQTKAFLERAGVRPIWARSEPHKKLVEGYFNPLWTAMSIALPPDGQIGRFRGEMKEETKLLMACRDGRTDPRGIFPDLKTFQSALDEAIDFREMDGRETQFYGGIVPREAWGACADPGANGVRPLPADLWAHALPVCSDPVAVRRQGVVAVKTLSPFGEPWQYVFAWERGFEHEGRKVVVRFDPWNIRAGAVVQDAATGRTLTQEALCTSPAPDIFAARGLTDPRSRGRALKKASRAAVLEIVRSLDERTFGRPAATARGTSPASAPLDFLRGRAAHLELDDDAGAAQERANGPDSEATDWAALEAGIEGIIA